MDIIDNLPFDKFQSLAIINKSRIKFLLQCQLRRNHNTF